jgi:hypothetical protein
VPIAPTTAPIAPPINAAKGERAAETKPAIAAAPPVAAPAAAILPVLLQT